MYSFTNFLLQSLIAAFNAKNRYGLQWPSIWSASAVGDRDKPQASASCVATRTGCAYANQPERLKDMSHSAAPSSRSDEACGLRPPRCKAEAATGRGSGAPGQGAPDTHSNLIGFAIILFWILYPLIKHL